MKKNGMLPAGPSGDFMPVTDTSDLIALRSDVNRTLCEYTWDLIFMDTGEAFD